MAQPLRIQNSGLFLVGQSIAIMKLVEWPVVLKVPALANVL